MVANVSFTLSIKQSHRKENESLSIIPIEVMKQSLTGSIWRRHPTLSKSLHPDWPDQDHMTSPKTRINPSESHRLEYVLPSLPFQGKLDCYSKDGSRCWASQTTSVSHNLLPVLEQQLCVCWMELLTCSHSCLTSVSPSQEPISLSLGIVTFSNREDWLCMLLLCLPTVKLASIDFQTAKEIIHIPSLYS